MLPYFVQSIFVIPENVMLLDCGWGWLSFTRRAPPGAEERDTGDCPRGAELALGDWSRVLFPAGEFGRSLLKWRSSLFGGGPWYRSPLLSPLRPSSRPARSCSQLSRLFPLGGAGSLLPPPELARRSRSYLARELKAITNLCWHKQYLIQLLILLVNMTHAITTTLPKTKVK